MNSRKMKPVNLVLRNIRINVTVNETNHHKCWHAFLTAILAFLLLTNNSLATAVLVVEVPGGIVYLSADSLEVEAQTRQAWKSCKIRKTGEMYWAASSNFMAYGYTGFFVEKIVASIGSSGTVEQKRERFIKAVVTPLQEAITDSKNRDPAAYSKFVLSGPIQLQIVFVQRQKSGPAWAFASFTWQMENGKVVVTPERVYHAVPTKEKPYSLGALGFYDDALMYFAMHHVKGGLEPNITEEIQSAMKAQGDAIPASVGPPYSILRFDRTGVKWINKGMCEQ